ncbi:hypothetical protein VTJ83DRAFT_5300 [Remersonia thermophila]|uniref:Cellobiose dehydrogenase-like cytochrome domain-containing protein n=1 Tax=Remersonia thermophila TaxID=72144 RepID=A0ABR4D6J0_9PEZI
MVLLEKLARVAAFLGLAKRQFEPDSSVYEDPETGLTFASCTTNRDVTVRIAIPDQIPADKIYDTVIQVAAPNDIGWFGWAWGGHMTYNPLAILWANGTNNVVLSPRIAYGYFSPPEHPDSSYTILSTGTHINETHWQVTAKCSGCSRWGDEWIGYTELDPDRQTIMAYAWSNYPVDAPEDASSTFAIHQSLGHPIYDLTVAKNADFEAKIQALL